jgi:hypothetical protein
LRATLHGVIASEAKQSPPRRKLQEIASSAFGLLAMTLPPLSL